MSTDLTPRSERERAREVAEARADLERRAAELGVRPFDGDEWLAESETDQTAEEITREVDEFLSMVREWRHTPSNRGTG
ncbi:MAG: hypothetical protein M3416_05905 [Acidobacteriota bacterium]|nr:hypothetical protein [Acidobacteriota bacterium]